MTRFPLVLLMTACFGASAFADERPLPPTVSVSGEAREDVRPDIVRITLEIAAEKPTAAEAQSEDSRISAAVIDGLKGAGVEAKDVLTVGLSLTPVTTDQLDPKTNMVIKTLVTGYRASNRISLRLRDIGRAGAVIGASVQAGALYEGVAYELSDREAHQDALRVKAAANAAHRAALYAEGAGVKLGALRSLSAGPGNAPYPGAAAPRMMSVGRAAPGPAPLVIEPGEIPLEETVAATYDLVAP